MCPKLDAPASTKKRWSEREAPFISFLNQCHSQALSSALSLSRPDATRYSGFSQTVNGDGLET